MFAVITIIFFVIAGCKEVPCGKAFISPYFVGFTVADIDTLVLRQFKSNDNFQNLIDTLLISNNHTSGASYHSFSDTTAVAFSIISGNEKDPFPGYDWEIYIPALNRTIFVSNIVTPQENTSCSACGCTVTSLMIDGQTVMPSNGTVSGLPGYAIYISK